MGGPVAAVTWQRDDTPLKNNGPLVIDDGETAMYHNDLEVTGRLPGSYTCQIRDGDDSVLYTMDYDVLGMLLHCDWFETFYHAIRNGILSLCFQHVFKF